MTQTIGRALVVLGHALVAVGAIMSPVAYAYDLLGTLQAIAMALGVIAVGVSTVLLGDKIADGSGNPNVTPNGSTDALQSL